MSPWLQRVTGRELLVDVLLAIGLTALSWRWRPDRETWVRPAR